MHEAQPNSSTEPRNMPAMTVGDLRDIIKPAVPLSPDDTVARAIRLLRARGLPALLVAHESRLVGMVTEADILGIASEAASPREAARSLPVAEVMRPIQLIAEERQSVSGLVQAVRQHSAPVVPVAAPDGRYLGLLLPRDILAAISGEPLVPPIAGLATPLGVYLTTGALRAGAGDLALAATGVALMVINLMSYGVLYALTELPRRWLESAPAQPAPELIGDMSLAAALIAWAIQVAMFLLLLRLSPLTRVHGAEHMVVRAIEEGEDLTLQKVRQMPRVHPRCGTNLMALLILLLIAQHFLLSMGETADAGQRFLALFAVVVVVLLSWRRLGAALQRWVTTRRPSDPQLERAIGVAESLLDGVRARPGARVKLPRRIWNSGFPQVLAGFAVSAAVIEYAVKLWSLLTG
jgi:CBS domain-containing protein